MVVTPQSQPQLTCTEQTHYREDGPKWFCCVFTPWGTTSSGSGGGTKLSSGSGRWWGKTLKFRDEEDLWLMNRKVSINQVVVES